MKIKPVGPNTRVRSDHNTAGNIVIPNLDQNDIVTGSEVFTAPTDFTLNSVVIQRTGDKWLKVDKVNDETYYGWIAITNMGVVICEEVPDDLPPSEEYIIHVKDGVQTKYVKESK